MKTIAILLLRDQGALIALDDTGSGYAGIQQVAELRPYVDPDRVRYAWIILSQDG